MHKKQSACFSQVIHDFVACRCIYSRPIFCQNHYPSYNMLRTIALCYSNIIDIQTFYSISNVQNSSVPLSTFYAQSYVENSKSTQRGCLNSQRVNICNFFFAHEHFNSAAGELPLRTFSRSCFIFRNVNDHIQHNNNKP